jgi:hypothetical protein
MYWSVWRPKTRAFLADYLPKIAREGNKTSIHDAELLRELVVYKFNLVARECMIVCNSVWEFEDALYSKIAAYARYYLSEQSLLADGMRDELDTGFTFFVLRANPWVTIPEEDRATAWHVGAIIGEALGDAALKLLAEAWKRASRDGFEATSAVTVNGSRPESTIPIRREPRACEETPTVADIRAALNIGARQ